MPNGGKLQLIPEHLEHWYERIQQRSSKEMATAGSCLRFTRTGTMLSVNYLPDDTKEGFGKVQPCRCEIPRAINFFQTHCPESLYVHSVEVVAILLVGENPTLQAKWQVLYCHVDEEQAQIIHGRDGAMLHEPKIDS